MATVAQCVFRRLALILQMIMNAVIDNARLSAAITHAHPEGLAGAVAVAAAAAHAWDLHDQMKPSRADFIDAILDYIPDSEVKSGIRKARDICSTDINHVVGMVGNGSRISVQDTVPYGLYCAAQWLDNYEEAIWQTTD